MLFCFLLYCIETYVVYELNGSGRADTVLFRCKLPPGVNKVTVYHVRKWGRPASRCTRQRLLVNPALFSFPPPLCYLSPPLYSAPGLCLQGTALSSFMLDLFLLHCSEASLQGKEILRQSEEIPLKESRARGCGKAWLCATWCGSASDSQLCLAEHQGWPWCRDICLDKSIPPLLPLLGFADGLLLFLVLFCFWIGCSQLCHSNKDFPCTSNRLIKGCSPTRALRLLWIISSANDGRRKIIKNTCQTWMW